MLPVARSAEPVAPLSARGLAVGNGGRTVVADVDLDLAEGSCTVLVGANGSGKSTLLRTIAGLQPPFAGTVTLAGRDLAHLKPRDAARTVTFLPQSPLVPSGINVRDLVLFGRHPHRRVFGGLTSDDHEAIDWALATTRMDAFADRPVDRLSGGERQRAWLAVALAQRTPVVLLDEPTTFLDIRFQLDVLRIIRTLVETHGLAVGVVLHDLNQAAVVADQLVVLADGEVIAAGPPREVLTPATVRRAFAVEADVDVDPDTGAPRCRFHLDDTRPADLSGVRSTPTHPDRPLLESIS